MKMKEHAMEQAARHAFDDVRHAELRHERATLERLAWEAQRAMEAYFDALKVYEEHRNEDASRRASADFEAGKYPM